MSFRRSTKRVCAALLFVLGARGSFANPALQLDSVEAAAGQEALLTLSINSEVQQVCGLLITLRFDTFTPTTAPALSLLNPGESRLGPAFKGALYGSAAVLDPNTGIALSDQRQIGIVHGDPVDGPTQVIRLPFEVPASATGGTVYTIVASVVANDFLGIQFPVDPVTATITVTLMPGDVNGNGKVEVSDVVLILRGSLGLENLTSDQTIRADCNKNGRVEVGDAVTALRIAIGLA
jgi:hypothetical protein